MKWGRAHVRRKTMRRLSIFVSMAALWGCGPSAEDAEKMHEVKAYLLKVVETENRYLKANQTYSLNIEELYPFEESLETPPAGYVIEGGGGLALAFGYEVQAKPTGSGPHFYVNTSGVVRYSNSGPADEGSKPVP
jgi:hypothetical protein